MRERLLQTIVIGLAFVVGMLLGNEACGERDGPQAEPPPAPVLVCPVCPSCPPLVEPLEPDPSPRRVPRTERARLPSAPDPDTRHREALLSWAQEQSQELRGCGGSTEVGISVVVTLWLDGDGSVARVEMSYDPGALPVSQATCVRSRVGRWRPPGELIEGRDRLVFGLVI